MLCNDDVAAAAACDGNDDDASVTNDVFCEGLTDAVVLVVVVLSDDVECEFQASFDGFEAASCDAVTVAEIAERYWLRMDEVIAHKRRGVKKG